MSILVRFRRDRSGLALTEYLVMIGLLTGGLVAAVALMFGAMENGWNGSLAGGALAPQAVDAPVAGGSGSGAGSGGAGTGGGSGTGTGGTGTGDTGTGTGDTGTGDTGTGGGNGNGNGNGKGNGKK